MLRSYCARHSLHRNLVYIASPSSRWRSSESVIDKFPPSSPSAGPKQEIPPQPFSVTPNHSSLSTFLQHARSIGLSPTSTTYVGTYYEYLCELSLRRLGFSLTRTGGRSDAGIDLLGSWSLPSASRPVPCIVQCKNLKAKAGPNLVRELEGAFAGAPYQWRGDAVIGVLCARREATKGVRDAIRSTKRGVVWCHIEITEKGTGRVRQLFWNRQAGVLGAHAVEVGLRYLSDSKRNDGACLDSEVVLTAGGKIWEPEINTSL